MASGSSGRNNFGTKAYDFCSDDILCSDEDYVNQESSNGAHSEPPIETNSTKEFHKSRMARSSVFPSSAYSPPEESLNQDMIATVEKTVKKYTDNLMRFLEGISSRLSQLELYCYNLDKSIGEMRSDLVGDHGEADSKLKSLEKHIQEVHRSMQILRDKQELAETQNELAKLQLAQKETTSSSHSQKSEERASPQASDPKKTESTSDVYSQQLALALPHQIAPQPSLPARPLEKQQQPPVGPLPPIPPPNMTQPQAYYLPSTQIPNPPGPTPQSHGQYLPSNSQYQAPQMQDLSRVAPQPTQPQVNQAPQIQPLPHYQQQQWPQQLPQAMQMPFSGMSQPGPSRMEPMPYGYGGAGKPVQPQPPPQQFKPTFGMQPEDGYTPSGPHPTHSQGNTYIMYESDGGRTHHSPQPPHFPQGGYPPTSLPPQNPQPNASNTMVRPSHFVRNHPYNDMIEKLVSMGYRGDHVLGLIQRMEESGQPVDFNAVLDRLNGRFSGDAQRGWSE